MIKNVGNSFQLWGMLHNYICFRLAKLLKHDLPGRPQWLANGLWNDLPRAVLGLFANHWGVLAITYVLGWLNYEA